MIALFWKCTCNFRCISGCVFACFLFLILFCSMFITSVAWEQRDQGVIIRGNMTPKILPGGQTWYFDPRFFHLATVLVPICLYCLNCSKFGQLVLRNIIKIVATICHIFHVYMSYFTAKMPWIRLWLGLCPRPRLGSSHHIAPQGSIPGFKGSYF